MRPSGTLTHYFARRALTTKQYQFCITGKNGSKKVCSDLGSIPGSLEELGIREASPIQREVLQLLLTTGSYFDIATMQSLVASSKIDAQGASPGLPGDQWIQEIVAWESAAWAMLQISVADHALGPQLRLPELGSLVSLANSTAEKKLCQTQRMRKAGGFV